MAEASVAEKTLTICQHFLLTSLLCNLVSIKPPPPPGRLTNNMDNNVKLKYGLEGSDTRTATIATNSLQKTAYSGGGRITTESSSVSPSVSGLRLCVDRSIGGDGDRGLSYPNPLSTCAPSSCSGGGEPNHRYQHQLSPGTMDSWGSSTGGGGGRPGSGPSSEGSGPEEAAAGNGDKAAASSGYDYEFVKKVADMYECPICCYVLRNANQTKCGHRFCRACIRKWISAQTPAGTRGSCPICFEELGAIDLFEDNFAKREILSLKIYCPHRQEGCLEVVELRGIDKHLVDCLFVLVKCPAGCKETMFRKDVENHQKSSCERRKIKCEVCGEEVSIDNQESHLQVECPMVEQYCPCCEQVYKRQELEAHKEKDCPKVLVNCHFKLFGCSTRLEREQLDTHMEINIQVHLKQVSEAVQQLIKNQPLTTEITALLAKTGLSRGGGGGGDGSDGHQHPQLPYRQAVHPRSTGGGTGGGGPHGGYDHLMRDRGLRDRDVSLGGLHRYSHPPMDNYPSHQMHTGGSDPLPSSPRVVYPPTDDYHPLFDAPQHRTLRRQSSLGMERSAASIGMQSVSNGHHFYSQQQQQQQQQHAAMEQTISHLTDKYQDMERKFADQKNEMAALQSQNREFEQRVKEQSRSIQALQEESLTLEAKNCNGMFMWKISSYSQKKYDAESGQRTVIHSQGFQTSVFGYKLCVRLNLNGVESATGTHISLFVHFMQGDYDEILDWPFAGKISLAILDQTEGTSTKQNITETLVSKPSLAAFQRPRSHRNHKGFGYVEFCPISVIEGSMPKYLKDDTIFIRVKVDLD